MIDGALGCLGSISDHDSVGMIVSLNALGTLCVVVSIIGQGALKRHD